MLFKCKVYHLNRSNFRFAQGNQILRFFAQNDCTLYFLKDLDPEIKSVRNDSDKVGYIKNV